MAQDSRAPEWSRRQVLEALGLGAVAATRPGIATAAAPVLPKGAVIRTILKDYAPEELGGGATLFHEHMSLATDFGARFAAATAAARAATGGRPGGGGGGGGGGPPPGPPPAAGAGRGPAAPAGPDPMRDA